MSIRRRHTFFFDFHDPDAVEAFEFSDNSVSVSHFKSAREDRIQIPKSVFEQALKDGNLNIFLDSVSQLQIKWSKATAFRKNYPAAVVHEPGLHVEFVSKSTPVDLKHAKALLSKMFGVDFTQTGPVDASKWSSLFAPLDSLATLSTSFQSLICSKSDTQCLDQVNELKYADSFALSYGYLPDNAKSHHKASDITIEAFWSDRVSMSKDLGIKTSTISKLYPEESKERVEVGILNVHPEYTTPSSIWGIAGFTRNLNEEKTEKILYQYTTKHRSVNSQYFVDFVQPVGLHPKHRLHMKNVKAPRQQCSLFAKYSFSKSLFLDRYQLKDLSEPTPNRPAIGQLYDVWGETDLEAPIWAVDGWGSESLVQLFTSHKQRNGDLVFELPTHSRYEVPQANTTYVHEYQPWPVVFWACMPPSENNKEELNAQDALELKIPAAVETRNLGYESVFPESTIFYYFDPEVPEEFVQNGNTLLYSEFDIPVAPFSSYSTVQVVTVAVILVSFFYLLYEIVHNALTFSKKEKTSVATKQKAI